MSTNGHERLDPKTAPACLRLWAMKRMRLGDQRSWRETIPCRCLQVSPAPAVCDPTVRLPWRSMSHRQRKQGYAKLKFRSLASATGSLHRQVLLHSIHLARTRARSISTRVMGNQCALAVALHNRCQRCMTADCSDRSVNAPGSLIRQHGAVQSLPSFASPFHG